MASILFTPFAGYLALRRRRRALVFAAAEVGYVAVMVAAALAGMPWVLWAALFLFAVHYLGALVDVGRLARVTPAQSRRWWMAVVLALLVGTAWEAAANGIRLRLVETFRIPGGSMIPALQIGDQFFVDKRSRPVRRGDLVVFRHPIDPEVDYVMRVVALGGDTIEIREGALLLNGAVVPARRIGTSNVTDGPGLFPLAYEEWEETLDDRTYRMLRDADRTRQSWKGTTVPEGHIFVLGDHRDNSSDSRFWGTVPIGNIKGHVLWIWWSREPGGRVRWERLGLRP